MTSKEALKKLINYLDLSLDRQDEEQVTELLNTIKKDLDRLEELKNEYIALEIWNEVIFKENKKLKKVIDILKNKLGLYVNDYINYATINAVLPVANNDCNRLTQQEYELLKEVLYNEYT